MELETSCTRDGYLIFIEEQRSAGAENGTRWGAMHSRDGMLEKPENGMRGSDPGTPCFVHSFH